MPSSSPPPAASGGASASARPRILVLSSLFPSAARPGAGLFVRERMFRVAHALPLSVVSPRPASPVDGLIRRLRPFYRPPEVRREVQQGIEVCFPRFPSPPGVGRRFDGDLMALGCLPLLYRRRDDFDIIDAHFAYPDGYAAARLGRRLGKPVTVTLRGTESRLARDPMFRRLLQTTLARVERVFCVSGSLARLAVELGADPGKVQTVPNGVDVARFSPQPREQARAELGIAADAWVLISVGGLVERKGFHRVIERLPGLIAAHPELVYLIVGGVGPEGDYRARLESMTERLGLAGRVRFLGQLAPEALSGPLSAADLFVLATSNEGWANVFLEAMACGLPVVTTDVGGNPEVVAHPGLGTIVPFGDGEALERAIHEALLEPWDRSAIRAHAEANTWDGRVSDLIEAFRSIV